MGGNVGFTIREEDGKEHRMCRWTNSTPDFINHSKFIEKDKEHLNDYLNTWYEMVEDYNGSQELPMSSCYVPGACLAPDGYGLIVVDYKTNTLLHLQGYTNYGRLLPSSINIATYDESPEAKEKIEDCKKLITTGKITKARAFSKELNEHFIEIKDFDQVLLSISERFSTDEKRTLLCDLIIDMNPWVIKRFDEDAEGVKNFKNEVLSLGFILTEEENKQWDEFGENFSE